MARVLLALGSNLGNRSRNLRQACQKIDQLPETKLLARSRWHETAPIGGPGDQQHFLNGAVVVQTPLEPLQLAKHLLSVESDLGRLREVRWDARIIDIDLLLYDDRRITLASLTLPHPRMLFRRFVLEPAVEVAGSWYHPVAGSTLAQLLRHLYYPPQTLQIVSSNRSVSEWLLQRLSDFLEHMKQEKAHIGNFTLPKIRIGEPPVLLGGGNKNISVEGVLDPFVTIELLRELSEEPTIKLRKKTGREKKTENFFLGKSNDPSLVTGAGPRLDIYSTNRNLIEQEAIAALQSAWPELYAPNP